MPKTNWEFRVKRQGNLFTFYAYLISQQRINKLFKISFKYKNLKWVDYELYYSEDENQEFMKIIKDKLLNNPRHLKRIVADNIKQAQKLNSLIKKIIAQRLDKLSDKQLKDAFKRYIETQIDFYGFWAISVPASRVVEPLVKQELSKKTDKVEDYFSSFTYPNRKLELTLEQLLLFKIGAEIEKRHPGLLKKRKQEIIKGLSKELKNKLTKHQQRFEWMESTNYMNKPCTMDFFVNRLKKKSGYAKLVKKIEKRNKEIESTIAKNIKALGLSKKAVGFINAMRDFIFLRNFEKENVNKNQFLVEPLIAELPRRLKIDRGSVLAMSHEEILQAFEGKLPPKRELAQRKKRFGAVVTEGKAKIVSGPEVEKYKEKKIVEKLEIIKGTTACKGLAKGVVKIVHSKEEIGKLKKGEILVTSMTTPDFVPAMEKAAAIITDEGGITCHAAIVSRELNTPCVIGTKIATKALKDGNFVEVNADKGIVKVLR